MSTLVASGMSGLALRLPRRQHYRKGRTLAAATAQDGDVSAMRPRDETRQVEAETDAFDVSGVIVLDAPVFPEEPSGFVGGQADSAVRHAHDRGPAEALD